MPYIVLCVMIFTGAYTLWALATVLSTLFGDQGNALTPEEAKVREHSREQTVWWSGLTGTISLVITVILADYLATVHPTVLATFGYWCLCGFCSRVLILIWRRQLLSPRYAWDEDEVYSLAFFMLGGVLNTVHLVLVIISESRPD